MSEETGGEWTYEPPTHSQNFYKNSKKFSPKKLQSIIVLMLAKNNLHCVVWRVIAFSSYGDTLWEI